MKHLNLWFIFSVLLIFSKTFALTQTRNDSRNRFEFKEYHMGVDVRIVVYSRDKGQAERACAAAYERFAELDSILSDYRIDSELMRLCSKSGIRSEGVSKDLFIVLQRAQEVAERSQGAFDVTCGPLISLWRTCRKTGVLPSEETLSKAKTLVGWRNMVLDSKRRTVFLLKSGMRLDLGGIGKGYADDCAMSVLKKHGIRSALIEAGGDIVVSAPPPDHSGWKITLANAATPGQSPDLSLADCAISTSGDTEQSVSIGGKRFSHIIDPRSGQALTDRIQVTIIAESGLTSDSLSTAVSVLGKIQGEKLIRTYSGTSSFIRLIPSLQ